VEIHRTARKHGIADEDIVHVVEHALAGYAPAMKRKKRATSGGVPVTNELIDQLAAEAQRGYDSSKLRRRGRPPLGAGPSEVVPVRLDPQLRRALEERAADEHTTQSDLIRRALRTYLDVA